MTPGKAIRLTEEQEQALNPQSRPVRRVRRKAMNVETFARFTHRAQSALGEVYDEYDPSPSEVVQALRLLLASAERLQPTTKRRTS